MHCPKPRAQNFFLHATGNSTCPAPFGSKLRQLIADITSEELCAEEDQNLFNLVLRLRRCVSKKASTSPFFRPDVNGPWNDVSKLLIMQPLFQETSENALTTQGGIL